MKTTAWNAFIQSAQAAGLLPTDAQADDDGRPWPVLVLTFLGAQLAAIPLLGFFGAIFGQFLLTGPGTYVAGALLMAGAFVLLRAEGVLLFVEHMALVALGVGIAMVDAALFRDLGTRAGGVCGALLCLASARLVAASWVRSLLGLCAVGLAMLGLIEHHGWWRGGGLWNWTSLLALLWLLALLLQDVLARRGRASEAAVVEAVQAGWLIGVLAMFAFSSGQTLLLGSVTGSNFVGAVGGMLQAEMLRHGGFGWPWRSTLAAVLPILLCLWARRRWPVAAHPLAGLLALSVAALAWFMPALGPVAVLGVVCLLTARPALAAASAFTAAWIIGAFYYSLAWGLQEKALLLILLGALLGAAAWLNLRRTGAREVSARLRPVRPSLWLAGLGLLATLAVLNTGIWQKEDLIAHGRKVFIELAPVDPRSLMQGDYMALNYRLGPQLQSALPRYSGHARVLAGGPVDARGVLQLEQVLNANEAFVGQKVELIRKRGRWLVVSDAWYFREGEGARWATARYAEFRVLPDGRALLVGMADQTLQPIIP